MPQSTTPAAPLVTGLVLCGGRGRRMGGMDKGLQPFRGSPLARYALDRLAPQVGPLLLNANRHLDRYASFGVEVVTDDDASAAAAGAKEAAVRRADGGFLGPLAGIVAGLSACRTRYLVSVPCDVPDFPADLVVRLVAAIGKDGAGLAVARAAGRLQPVFCLIGVERLDALRRFVAEGGRGAGEWAAASRAAVAEFDDAGAFSNANTLDELRALEALR